MILEGEMKDAKLSIFFYLNSKYSLNFNFLCIFFMNYQWVWKKTVKSKIGIHIRVHVITVDLIEMVHMQVLKTTTKTLGKSKLWKLKVDFKENEKSIGYNQIKNGQS